MMARLMTLLDLADEAPAVEGLGRGSIGADLDDTVNAQLDGEGNPPISPSIAADLGPDPGADDGQP